MLRSVEGVYKDGKIKLLEKPADIQEARVIVTFLPSALPSASREDVRVDLRRRGIDKTQAASLRARLKPFAEDWEREDMEAYNAL